MPIVEGGRFSPENRIVSPGVFTREIDQSGIAQGVAEIGGVVVPQGCFQLFYRSRIPSIWSFMDFMVYTATQYLQEKDCNVCR